MNETKHIVLIEDNDADYVLIEEALTAMHRPFKTTRFRDGAEALRAVLAPEAELPDLILLDLNMPRSAGLDILQQIRKSPKLGSVPVAILTSSESGGDQHRAARMGASAYIHKPSTYDRFIATVGQTVRAMLDRKGS